jgi:2-dehydro-3-deoxyphosphogluconate aldolase/(4S)-4-hydroxy-2-oxoglutarate aldolase
LDAIKAMVDAVPVAIVGAGTVTSTRDLDNALAAGSQFIITPGQTPSLLKAGVECGVPYMPGTATVSELMCCVEQGLDTVKFFPAEASGGAKALAAFGGPFPDIKFCPTGGVNLANLADYLAVKSVMTVGGSWIAPSALVAAKDWQGITALAQAATDKVADIRAQLG